MDPISDQHRILYHRKIKHFSVFSLTDRGVLSTEVVHSEPCWRDKLIPKVFFLFIFLYLSEAGFTSVSEDFTDCAATHISIICNLEEMVQLLNTAGATLWTLPNPGSTFA